MHRSVARASSPRRCPCGAVLHYPDTAIERFVRRQIRRFGTAIVIQTPDGTWRVPVHYLALHGGFRPSAMRGHAIFYGWDMVDCDGTRKGVRDATA